MRATRFGGEMARPEGIFIPCEGEAPEPPPSIASPGLNAPALPPKPSRKGQGKLQVAERAIAVAELLLPPTAFAPPAKRGRPAKTGENGAPAARKPLKPIPEYKQVRACVVDSDSASDNDIPELSINLEPHAAEEVAAADAPAHLYWTRCPDAGYNPLFDHDKYKKASGNLCGEFAH